MAPKEGSVSLAHSPKALTFWTADRHSTRSSKSPNAEPLGLLKPGLTPATAARGLFPNDSLSRSPRGSFRAYVAPPVASRESEDAPSVRLVLSLRLPVPSGSGPQSSQPSETVTPHAQGARVALPPETQFLRITPPRVLRRNRPVMPDQRIWLRVINDPQPGALWMWGYGQC